MFVEVRVVIREVVGGCGGGAGGYGGGRQPRLSWRRGGHGVERRGRKKS